MVPSDVSDTKTKQRKAFYIAYKRMQRWPLFVKVVYFHCSFQFSCYQSDFTSNSSYCFSFQILMENSEYHSLRDKITKELRNQVRCVPIEERKDTGVLSAELMSSICHGNDSRDTVHLALKNPNPCLPSHLTA